MQEHEIAEDLTLVNPSPDVMRAGKIEDTTNAVPAPAVNPLLGQ